MKLCHLIYIIWCLLRRAQGSSHEDNLRESDNTVIEGLAQEQSAQGSSHEDNLRESDNTVIEGLAQEQSAQGSSHEDNLRESDNTVIEGLALENTQLENADSKVDSHMEMLTDFEDEIREEYAHPQSRQKNIWTEEPLQLALGEHTFCGPYTFHYTKRQDCHVVGHHYHFADKSTHITVRECELLCDKVYLCNAINWSHNWEAGCVLRECGYSQNHPPKPFPMPIGYKWDWISFSKFQPDEIPECKKEHGSYDTPNNYCGPYNHQKWDEDECPQLGEQIEKVQILECEQKWDDKLRCTGFHYWRDDNKCSLISCWGSTQPLPKRNSRFFLLPAIQKIDSLDSSANWMIDFPDKLILQCVRGQMRKLLSLIKHHLGHILIPKTCHPNTLIHKF